MNNWYVAPVQGEVPFSEIEKKAENGEYHYWKYETDPFGFRSNGYEDLEEKLRGYTAIRYNKATDAEKEKMIDEVLAIYRSRNIFPIQYFSEMGISNEIEKCIAYKAYWDGDTVSCGPGVGTGLCRFLFPNIFDTPSKHDLDKKDAETQYKKFLNDEYLRRAIKFCFSYKDGCPVPTSVEGGLRLVGSAPSNFRPMNAKAVYEKFCPAGGTIYDFCCVDDETEYFNGYEWKSLKNYKEGDKVLQYNEDGTASLVEPLEYIHYKSNSPFYEYKVEDSINFCLTGNHDVVYRNKQGKLSKIKVDAMRKKALKNDSTEWYVPFTAVMQNSRYSVFLSREELADLVIAFRENRVDFKSPYLEVKEGCVVLSDRVITLSKENREYLLKLLVGTPESDIVFICKKVQLAQVQLLWNLTFHRKLISADFSLVTDVLKYDIKVSSDTELGKEFAILQTDKSEKYEDCDCYFFEKHNGELVNLKTVQKEDKYCFVVPSHMLVLRRGGIILITGNCGFGGRMLGALSSKKNYKYVGTDPNTETMYHLHQLGNYIEQVTGRENSYELHCCGSEDFKGKPNSIDFAFSSPPYFDLEVYSDEPTQCFNKFPNLNDWLEGYVRATIKNIYHMLKAGRCYAVNIADFKVGSGTCAYVDEWIRISTEEGMPLFDTVYLGVTARAGSAEQAKGEKKKENILIFKKPLC